MRQPTWKGYLSHQQTMTAQASLHIHTVSQKPLHFAHTIHVYWGPPRGFGKWEQEHLFQGNKCLKVRGTGNKGYLGEQGTQEINILILWNGNKAIYFRGTRDQVPTPLEGPLYWTRGSFRQRARYLSLMEPHHEKICLCHMWTTKAQISLRIHAVWSAPLLFTAWIVWYLYLLQPKLQDPS